MRIVQWAAALAVASILLAAPASAQRDHVLCYKIKTTLFEPKLPRGFTARVEDALDPNNALLLDPNEVPGERSTFNLKKVKEVCIPSDMDGLGLIDPDSHWVVYDIKAGKGGCANDPAIACKKERDCSAVGGACNLHGKFTRKLARNQGVRIVDQFNDIRVDMSRESSLMVPATMDGDGFLGLPNPAEQYKCYAIKPTKKLCEDGDNAGNSCRNDNDCPDGTCVALPKFPKDTHPDGLEADLVNPITTAFDVPDPDRPFALRKLKMFCQAADKKMVGEPVDERIEAQAGLLCYTVKAPKFACDGGDQDNQACRNDDDCVGTAPVPVDGVCRAEPKFDNRDPKALGFHVEDAIFQHRLDLRKEEVLCVPACKEPPVAASFSPHVLRLNSVQIRNSGHAFVPIANIVNSLLPGAISSGSINLLLEADRFGDGQMEIHSYTGSLDPANAGCNINDGNQNCDYLIDPESVDPSRFKTRTSCNNAGLIVIPVNVGGTDTEPSATVAGGDADTSFSLSFPFTNTVTLNLSARNVHLNGDLTHAGGVFTNLSNATLTGAVLHRDFKQTANELPQGLCQGGGNNNEPCMFSDAMCDSGFCNPLLGTCAGGANAGAQCGDDSTCPDLRGGNPSDACVETYIGGFTPVEVAGFIDSFARDVDLDGELSCEGATNNGEPCVTLDDCPDEEAPSGAECAQNEASSLILQFTAIDAAISGIEP